jgi:sugar phosphate isomerase/epimerase
LKKWRKKEELLQNKQKGEKEMYRIIAFCKWCQEMPIKELGTHLKKMGFDGVDLPCRDGAPITHATAPEKLPEARKILNDCGLTLDRLVTGIKEADAETERFLAAIRECGIKKIRIGDFSVGEGEDADEKFDTSRRKLYKLQSLMEKYHVQGAIQNHSGNTLAVNVSSLLRLIQDCDPEWIGIQYDPGHCNISGEPIPLAIGLMKSYLHSVNIKSGRQEYFIDKFSGTLQYAPVWVPLGDGMLDIPLLLKQLRAAGYKDPISLHAEYRTFFHRIEKNREATDELITEDLKYLRHLMTS